MLGSFVGFIHENLLTILKGDLILRQGLIYGPFIVIYGIGLVAFYYIFSYLKSRSNFDKKSRLAQFFFVFLVGFLVGGITEYLSSYIQEKAFGTISWDYSNLMLDLNGRTSLFHSIFWGLMSLFFYEILLPILTRMSDRLERPAIKNTIFILSLFMIFDISISALAVHRQSERRNDVPARGRFDTFLDETYPDARLDAIFSNSRVPER